MIDRESLRKMCEHEYSPSLVGEAIVGWAGLTAEQKARRIWKMDETFEQGKEPKQ
jgi:hypothetical protein